MVGLLSYSAFLTLYLIAIAFPQGAYLSLETKTTQDEKMFVSNPYRAAQPSKSTSSRKSEAPSLQKDTMQHRCPSCNDSAKENEDLLVTKQRIEMIKAKILEKLQMDKEPEVSQNFKEARIAALLSKLNLIGEENKENQPESPEDGFYGKTTQIITFSEEGKTTPFVYETMSWPSYFPQYKFLMGVAQEVHTSYVSLRVQNVSDFKKKEKQDRKFKNLFQ